ncbi:MAG: substrate-binding domain-containing protein [Anaerolineales bacterium]|nr:substrate-binding domain-containing protein [Anaerolineales bacterium]
MKKMHWIVTILVLLAIVLTACETPTAPPPETIIETVEVKVVETKEVEVVKEVEKVVVATPEAIDLWAPEDVTAATGSEKCAPLAALPKKFSKATKIGFVGANNAHPFHGLVQKGIEDAAKFYGVEFVNMDAAGGPEIDLAETMMTQGVQAIGVLGQGMDTIDPVGASAQEKGILFIPADSGKTDYSPYTYGVADSLSGKRGGELLAEGVTKKMEGDWAGKELFFLEATYNAIPACVARTGGAKKAFAEAMGLDEAHLIQFDAAVGNVSDMIKATLTANPDAVFGMIPCWDQLGVDPWNVAKEAGRGADVMLVTLGGDKPYADLLITKPENYYGYVEFQPYCEGWGWTETAIALLEGIQVVPYVPRTVTTQDTIDARFAELYPNP